MNYTKLTVAVAAGVLIAAGILLFWFVGVPEYYRQKRVRLAFMREAAFIEAVNCSVPSNCVAEKYQRHLNLVKKKLANVAQAAHGYCEATEAVSTNKDRNAQLIEQCQRPTEARMTADLR